MPPPTPKPGDIASVTSDASTLITTDSTAGHSAFSRLRRARSIADQVRDVSAIPQEKLDVANLPAIEHHGKQYILEKWLHRRRQRTSWITGHGTYLVELVGNKADGTFWSCGSCSQLFSANATTGPTTHLNKSHAIYEDSEEPPRKTARTVPVDEMFRQEAVRRGALRAPILQSESETIKSLLLQWIISSNLPFTVVESPEFRNISTALDPEKTRVLLPESGTSVKRLLVEKYLEQAAVVKREISLAPPQMKHISFDLWTSPNSYALLGIVAHYLDISGSLQTRLLGLRRIRGHNGGENLAPAITEVAEEFGLTECLGYLQSDNVESNDKCVAAVLRRIHPDLPAGRVSALKQRRRVRCFGHILNLAAKALLEGKNPGLLRSFEPGSQARLEAEEERDLLEQWRKRGPIGKLHNIVHFVRRSPQRRDSFAEVMPGKLTAEEVEEFGRILFDGDLSSLQLRPDNDTRWNSVFFMIERALLLRVPIEIFCHRWHRVEKDPQKKLPAEDLLDQEDWAALVAIKSILEPFKSITKRPQRTAGLPRRLADFAVDLPGQRNRVLRPLEAPPQPEPQPDPQLAVEQDLAIDGLNFLQVSLDLAIAKLDKYVVAMEQSPAYWAAMILHPGHRTRWLERNFGSDRRDNIIATFKRFYQDEYCNENDSQQPAAEPMRLQPTYLYGHDYYDPPEDPSDTDEVETYLGEPVQMVEAPLTWWKEHQSRFPRLSRMAFDLLTIPATSSECERTFSQAKLTIGIQRQSIHDDTVGFLRVTLAPQIVGFRRR
ncbi:hypothetical protein CHGG_08331 [Chaetomium globosum CBS 148.51]|uniref:HAT C-terminal dimerisation domain-containing protein n=1 Tax=Chaetomium globosum (strain ATCC 6205 / CBS 148.51 / DSM 1962 / NBRC 6347 / NRRL 1970) TaxID=306901 RepID=Q2GUM3_CHAGB|nr:uncharacterized protein CHGG_08331 [Chaetomium globosum CBS 148.51]EAQ87078.1 hypothetical protein CHGG_08331 [Chaetomium globosum CBS 148.51]